jgi:hypothetical protein
VGVDTHAKRAAHQISLLKAYLLGDRLLAPRFVQDVQHNFVHWLVHRQFAYYGTILHAYANLGSDNLILQVLVDVYCKEFTIMHDGSEDNHFQFPDQLPGQFVFDVASRFSKLRGKYAGDIELEEECYYHEHKSDEEKKRCRAGDEKTE